MTGSKLCFYTNEDNDLMVSRELKSEMYNVTQGVTTVQRACQTGIWPCADGADQQINEKDLRRIKIKAEDFYG